MLLLKRQRRLFSGGWRRNNRHCESRLRSGWRYRRRIGSRQSHIITIGIGDGRRGIRELASSGGHRNGVRHVVGKSALGTDRVSDEVGCKSRGRAARVPADVSLLYPGEVVRASHDKYLLELRCATLSFRKLRSRPHPGPRTPTNPTYAPKLSRDDHQSTISTTTSVPLKRQQTCKLIYDFLVLDLDTSPLTVL
jgi:hypothetical protein